MYRDGGRMEIDLVAGNAAAGGGTCRRRLANSGIKAGDRVGLFAPNCPEWHIADFAVTGLGAASVPIYFNESPDRFVYIMNDAGARVMLTAGEAQARKSRAKRASACRRWNI